MITTVKSLVRWILAAFFVVAGVGHLTILREDFAAMVPPPFDQEKDPIVFITGIMEILGGLGLVIPATRRSAKGCLILFLIAVFPANIYSAQNHIPFRRQQQPSVPVRLALQILLIALIGWSASNRLKSRGL